MEYELLGWAESAPGASAAAGPADENGTDGERARDGPRLRLDWRAFAYAGKFVLPGTGKAVARDAAASSPGATDGSDDPVGRDAAAAVPTVDPAVVGAVAFSPDRTDFAVLSVRYVTVRRDRQGAGIGPRLLAFVSARAGERGYERVRIAVNNPQAYVAAARAGFAFAGRETGIAEVVCERAAGGAPDRPDPGPYARGLRRFADREPGTGADESDPAFAAERLERGPPEPVDVPGSGDSGRH